MIDNSEAFFYHIDGTYLLRVQDSITNMPQLRFIKRRPFYLAFLPDGIFALK